MAAFLFRVSAPTSRKPLVTDAFLLNQAIEALRAYSLVTRNPGAKAFSVHRLVQVVLVDSMTQESRQQWTEHASWPQCERLLSHALVAAQLIEQEQITRPEAARLLNRIGYYLDERARYQEAERYCQLTGNCRVIASEFNVKVGHGPKFCPKKHARKGLK